MVLVRVILTPAGGVKPGAHSEIGGAQLKVGQGPPAVVRVWAAPVLHVAALVVAGVGGDAPVTTGAGFMAVGVMAGTDSTARATLLQELEVSLSVFEKTRLPASQQSAEEQGETG